MLALGTTTCGFPLLFKSSSNLTRPRLSYLYCMDFGSVREKVLAHEDAVSCMQLRGDMIVSGSWDSTVKFWQLTPSAISPLWTFGGFQNHSEVKCIDLGWDQNICIFGNDDGSIFLSDQRTPDVQRTQRIHSGAIRSIVLSPDGRQVFTGGADGTVHCVDVGSLSSVYELKGKDQVM